MSDFFKGLWPRSLFTWLGLVLGAMSVLALIRHGFNYGFGPTFTLLLAYYENLMHAVIGWWAEPIIKAWLAAVASFIGWHRLHLYPHWKHVLVLIGLHFNSHVRLLGNSGHANFVVFARIWGLAIALVAAVAAGCLSIGDPASQLALAAYPITGVCLYGYGVTHVIRVTRGFVWIEVAQLHNHVTASIGTLALLAVFVLLQLHPANPNAPVGLMALAIFVGAVALYWITSGLSYAGATLGRFQQEKWYANSSHVNSFLSIWYVGGRPGFYLLATASAAIILVLANAGLRFYDL